jgi:DUF971 family protein
MKESQRTPNPTNITYHQASRLLSLEFDDGRTFDLSSEFLRVFTPSAEARGHGPGQEVLQTGKREVAIERIEPVGNYAICPVFSDGHDTGIYSWDMLYEFGRHHDELWAAYLEKIEAARASRDPQPVAAGAVTKGGCGGGSCSK